jgi:oligoribonuclease
VSGAIPYLIIDFETSGLNTAKALVLEVACLALNDQLEEVSSISHVIDPRSIEELSDENMEAEAMNLHANNGLLDDIKSGKGLPMDVVRGNVIRWCSSIGINVDGRYEAIMGGSNPEFDRAFLRRFIPEVSSFLHYRCLDVATLRCMAGIVLGTTSDVLKATLWPVKQGPTTHRALVDCRNSAAELRAYRDMMTVGKGCMGVMA